MSFRAGDEAICIDVSYHRKGALLRADLWLEKGCIYRIRWIGECPYAPWRDCGPCVRLVGIVRVGDPQWPDFPFAAFRFRPVISRSTEAEVAKLKKLLIRSGRKIKERV